MKWPDVNPNEGTVSRTSTSLLLRAQADDSDAWQQLVNTYSRRVYRWCRHAGLQPADAGNVVQEVLRAVARKLPEFRREQQGDTFRGWLRRITQNKLRDHFRNLVRHPDQAAGGTDAHQRLMRISMPDTDDRPGSLSADSASDVARHAQQTIESPADQNSELIELREASLVESGLSEWGQALVRRIRSECSDRDWRFFWRVVVDGQSAVEVGKEFGVTANTVRLVKMRILRRLRESVAEAGPAATRSSTQHR